MCNKKECKQPETSLNKADVINSVCDCEKCKPFINFAAGFRKNKTCIKNKQTDC